MPTASDPLPQHDSLAAARLRLAESWAGRERFVMLDTHFSLGLGFLATWHAWRADLQRPQQLHYLALQNQPWTAPALIAALAARPEWSALAQELLAAWPTPVPGFHRILLANGAVVLTLIFGEVEKNLSQIDAQVDAFHVHQAGEPTQAEPDSARLFATLGRLAAPHATLALDAAGDAHIGAAIASGFVLAETTRETHAACVLHWAPRWTPRPPRAAGSGERHAIVIGAGLAGSAACERLAARGWQISLIEQHAQAAQEASGNLAGIFMPLIARDDNPGARLSRAAFLFALHLWQRLGGIGHAFAGEACGVLQFARDALRAGSAQEINRSEKLPPEFAQWLDAAAVAALAGMPNGPGARMSQAGGWLFPQGGWAHPGQVCEALLAACGDRLQRYFGKSATRLERANHCWKVYDEHDAIIAQAPQLIVANGMGFRNFSQTASLPLAAIRGQVTYLPSAALPTLPLVVCGDGYVTRPFNGTCSVGASYDADGDPGLRLASQQENLARLASMLPNVPLLPTLMPLAGRVGFRCVSMDRLPLVGAIPDHAAMAAFRGERLRDVPRLTGLYGLLGYASRGLTWAPLAAELLAAQITGEPLPLERELTSALDPARFCLNAHRRSGQRRLE